MAVGNLVKRLQDIMRKDAGINGFQETHVIKCSALAALFFPRSDGLFGDIAYRAYGEYCHIITIL